MDPSRADTQQGSRGQRSRMRWRLSCRTPRRAGWPGSRLRPRVTEPRSPVLGDRCTLPTAEAESILTADEAQRSGHRKANASPRFHAGDPPQSGNAPVEPGFNSRLVGPMAAISPR